MSDRYPTSDEEPGPLDPIVDVLREADATHKEKAIALLAAARAEYWYAREDGQIAGPPAGEDGFEPWAMNTISMLDGVLERMEDG